MILLNAHDHGMISPYRRTSVLRHTAFQAHGSIVQEPLLSLHIIHKENRKWHLLLVKGDHILSFPVVQSTVVSRGYPAVPVAVVFFIFHNIDFISGKMSRCSFGISDILCWIREPRLRYLCWLSEMLDKAVPCSRDDVLNRDLCILTGVYADRKQPSLFGISLVSSKAKLSS